MISVDGKKLFSKQSFNTINSHFIEKTFPLLKNVGFLGPTYSRSLVSMRSGLVLELGL